MSTVQTTIAIPSIMTANTYFWKPGLTASARRRNETRNTSTVAEFLKTVGFEIITHDANYVTAKIGDVEVYFHYSESANNVYKSLHITNKGLTTNITTIRKMLK